MKRFFVALLSFLYITTSTGATVHMHYCMGKLADWGLVQIESKTCGKCGMEKTESKDKGCCTDELQFFKDDGAQKITEPNTQLPKQSVTALPVAFIKIPFCNNISLSANNHKGPAPPLITAVAVYIINCSFLI